MSSPGAAPEPDAPAPVRPASAGPVPLTPPGCARVVPGGGEPMLPEQSREDTDAAWGDYRERERDDDRLCRDRPPHWDDF